MKKRQWWNCLCVQSNFDYHHNQSCKSWDDIKIYCLKNQNNSITNFHWNEKEELLKKIQLKFPFQFISAMLCTHKNKSESIYWSDVCVASRVLWNAMIFICFERNWIECLWFRFPSTQIPIWPTFNVQNFHEKKISMKIEQKCWCPISDNYLI